MKKGMVKFSKVMDQFGEEHHWMKESAECLEQCMVRESSENAKTD